MSEEAQIRTFTEALAVMEDGQLVHDLAEMQRDLIAALHDSVMENGGKAKGSLTIKLDYKLDGGMIEIQGDVKSSLPKVKRARTVMWATPDNNLSRNNPRQRALFEDVNQSAPPVRTA